MKKQTKAEKYLDEETTEEWKTERFLTIHRLHRAIIARLRGDLDQARDLIQICLGTSQSLSVNVTLYGELALVEHLTGNKELAYSYAEKGVNLFRQTGMSDTLPPQQCHRVIERMKHEGTW